MLLVISIARYYFTSTFPVPCQPLLVIETVLSYIVVREEQICRNCSPKASELGCFTMLNMRVSSYCEDKMYLLRTEGVGRLAGDMFV